ncbi:hypothetical protein SynA1528_01854 [Synechococcus sp. A15-28]|nr:hypothetical protein SynA1528_01854 [Synechococcus sp. A15-28]
MPEKTTIHGQWVDISSNSRIICLINLPFANHPNKGPGFVYDFFSTKEEEDLLSHETFFKGIK